MEARKVIDQGTRTQNLWTLAYYSTARRDWTADHLTRIAEMSAARNATHDVTGVLVHWDGSYFQVLEGDRENVLKVYEDYILDDPGHSGLIPAIDAPITARSFSEWRMAAYDLQADDKIVAFRTLIDELAEKLAAATPDEVKTLTLLHSFITTNCEHVL